MSIVQCFFLEPTGRSRHALRRYRGRFNDCPTSRMGYHDAESVLGIIDKPEGEDGPHTPRDDPRWSSHCSCGYAFQPEDNFQDWARELYRRADTGEEMTLREAPPGAMWFAPWLSDLQEYRGPDGHTLVVKLPDGSDWIVDGRASNCTMPDDKVHKCWVRHGTPPMITVDKNGLTCGAGSGSILTRGYHGFLIGGQLRQC